MVETNVVASEVSLRLTLAPGTNPVPATVSVTGAVEALSKEGETDATVGWGLVAAIFVVPDFVVSSVESAVTVTEPDAGATAGAM